MTATIAAFSPGCSQNVVTIETLSILKCQFLILYSLAFSVAENSMGGVSHYT